MKRITFKNNKGVRMRIPEKTTIRQLVEMGMKSIKFAPVGSPIRRDWWADAGPDEDVDDEPKKKK